MGILSTGAEVILENICTEGQYCVIALRYGFNIINNLSKYYRTGRRIFLRIVAPRDTPRHPNKIEMERHEACFKSNSDQEFKYFCLMPCNALFGDKCYPFFRGVLEI